MVRRGAPRQMRPARSIMSRKCRSRAARGNPGSRGKRIVNQSKRGFTLIELMIVVAIIGILAVLAIYGVRKYLANAKTAEARNSLGQMGKDEATAFEKESMTGAVLGLGSVAGLSRSLCLSA